MLVIYTITGSFGSNRQAYEKLPNLKTPMNFKSSLLIKKTGGIELTVKNCYSQEKRARTANTEIVLVLAIFQWS